MILQKILIIDDEKPLLRALEFKLSREGFGIKTAGDGNDALKLLQTETFDLILLDLFMPKMDGYAFLKELRIRNMHVPVIVLSNLGQQADFQKAKDLGALEYFVKADISVSGIVDRVKSVLASASMSH